MTKREAAAHFALPPLYINKEDKRITIRETLI